MVAQAEQSGLVNGLHLTSVLGRGAHSVVWSAVGHSDRMPWPASTSVVVKLALDSSAEHGGPLRREARFLARLRHPAVVRAWSLDTTNDGREYLVLSRASDGSLADLLRRGPLSVERCVAIVRSVTSALHEAHSRGVVHRDLKPGNVLLDQGASCAWLSDFGLAEDMALAALDVSSSRIAGSFLYAAPEQSGMLRREVDGRSDLYALGGVLFECLTGRPPFQADEVETLLSLHATVRPPEVRALREGVPESLAAMVAKLLSKDPDDRYPTAESLLFDLERSAAGETSFELATNHHHADAIQSAPLIGREQVVAKLREQAFDLRAETGAALWICGDQGMGKGRLCRALTASNEHARVLWARCDLNRESSLGVFRGLLSDLLRATPAAELAPLLDREGPALSRLFPDVKGLPAPAVELQPDAALEALARTFVGLASPERPLVMVFEGADRLGLQELGLLRRLATYARNHPLWLLCTGTDSPLTQDDALWFQNTLEPLERTHIETLIRHLLGPCPFDRRLTDLVLQCSAGNPEEAWLRICAALADGVLETDGTRWHFDERRFVSLDVPGSVSAPLPTVLARLPAEARDILCTAALLGRSFEAPWLEYAGHDREQTDRALWMGIQLRLIASSDGRHMTFVKLDVVDMLASELTEEVRRSRYTALARALEQAPSPSAAERALLARACFSTATATSAPAAYERCLDAGLHALDACAFSEARSLLIDAALLAESHGLATDFRLHRALAQLEAQGGEVEQAVASFQIAIASCPDAQARAAMHLRCGELRFFHQGGHPGPLREHLEQGWKELGRSLPTPSPWSWLVGLWFILIALCVEKLGFRAGADADDPRAKTQLRLCELTGMYYFFRDSLPAAFRCGMQGWYLGRRIGSCRELAGGIAGMGNFCYTLGLRRWAEAYYVEVYAMAEQLKDAAAYAYVRYMEGVGHSFAGNIQRGELILAQTLERHAGDLDIAYLATGASNLALSYIIRGDVKRATEVLARVREHVHARLGAEAPLPESCVMNQIEVLIQSGCVTSAEVPVARLKERLTDPEADPVGWFSRWQTIAVYELARGADDSQVRHALDQASRSRVRAETAPWLIARGFIIAAYVRLGLYQRAAPSAKPGHKRELLLAIERARRTRSSPSIRGDVHVLRAAGHWVSGRVEKAEAELAKAEREAQRRDMPSVLIEARALRAAILLDLGRDEAARHEARSAIAAAHTCGRLQRAAEIERELSIPTRAASSTSQISSSGRGAHSAIRPHAAQRERDMLVQVAAAASRELEPRAQARVVLDRLIGLFGAERGLIFADDASGELVRLAGRSAQQVDLENDVVFARSLVQRVRDSGTPLVLNGTEHGATLGSESVVAANLRSMVCTPIRLGDQIRGVVYLDSSLAKGVFTRDDLDILEAMGGHIALTQEMARAARVEIERRELDKDLQVSGAIQSLLLPEHADVSVGTIELSAAYAPASHSGGDWWAWEELADGKLWLLVADATGHGAGAAMVTAVLAGSYRSLVDSGVNELPTLLTALNSTVVALCRGRHTVTLLALEWDPQTSGLRLLSAAAPPVLLRHADGSVESCVLRGSALGTTPFVIGETTLSFEPESRVLVVSDGILEMSMADGRELGIRRLRKLLESHGTAEATALRDTLVREINTARGDAPVEDDLTLVVLSRR